MLIALLWVVLGLGSLASVVVALWIAVSLSRAASGGTSHPIWSWVLALVITLALPFALATWRHQKNPRRISLTMAWLPMLWNATGLLVAVALIPDVMGAALRGHGADVTASQLGESHSATRLLSALGHHTADVIDAPPGVGDAARDELTPFDPDEGLDAAKAISVPLTEDRTAIFVDVELEGFNGRHVKLPYLFDTGASFTTISTKVAKEIGIEIPADAPVLTFNTATGRRDSRMVYLPAVRIGQVRVESLLVSVCDGCSNEGHSGLLGQNVMRRFLARIDFKNGRMLLLPRLAERRPNRAYDIKSVVNMEVEGGPAMFLDRIHWVILVENQASVPMRDVTPTVKFTDGPLLTGETIEEIKPGEVGRSLVKGRVRTGRDKPGGHFQLGLAEAYW